MLDSLRIRDPVQTLLTDRPRREMIPQQAAQQLPPARRNCHSSSSCSSAAASRSASHPTIPKNTSSERSYHPAAGSSHAPSPCSGRRPRPAQKPSRHRSRSRRTRWPSFSRRYLATPTFGIPPPLFLPATTPPQDNLPQHDRPAAPTTPRIVNGAGESQSPNEPHPNVTTPTQKRVPRSRRQTVPRATRGSADHRTADMHEHPSDLQNQQPPSRHRTQAAHTPRAGAVDDRARPQAARTRSQPSPLRKPQLPRH